MARTRTWWNHSSQVNLVTWPIAENLLDGSGLDVPGATIRRTLGTLHATTVTAFPERLPVFQIGVLISTGATGAELFSSQWNDVDWLYLTTQIPRALLQPPGTLVATSTADASGSWDSGVSRKLEVGESLWFVTRPLNADTTQDQQYRLFSRTLVLNPA